MAPTSGIDSTNFFGSSRGGLNTNPNLQNGKNREDNIAANAASLLPNALACFQSPFGNNSGTGGTTSGFLG